MPPAKGKKVKSTKATLSQLSSKSQPSLQLVRVSTRSQVSLSQQDALVSDHATNIDAQRDGDDRSQPETSSEAISAEPAAEDANPVHAYGTRSSTHGRRPAKAAGLAKRTLPEIRAEAAAKQAIADAARAKKIAEDDAKAAESAAKKDSVVLLQQQRAAADELVLAHFDTAPSAGESDTGHFRADERWDYEPDMAEALSPDSRSPIAAAPQHRPSAFSLFDDTIRHDSSDPGTISEFDEPDAAPRRLGGRRSRLLMQEGEILEISSDSEVQVPPNEDAGAEVENGTKKPKLTAAQRKAETRREVRDDLAARAISNASTSKALIMRSGSSAKDAKVSQAPKTDAFTVDWRRKLHASSQSSPSLATTPRKTSTSGPSRPHSVAKAHVDWFEDCPDDDGVGGFADADVRVDRPVSLHSRKQGSLQGNSRVQFVETASDLDKGSTQKRKKMPKPPPRPKKAKVADPVASSDGGRSDADPEPTESLAYDALPDWVKPGIKSTVVPSIVEYIAAQQDPWSLDTQRFTLQGLVQKCIDRVFPERYYHVEKRDNIYKWCQQQVYEWHRAFQKAANASVRDEKATRQADTRLSTKDRSEQGIASWLDRALRQGGAAMWGQPNTENPGDAREQLQSKYILRVMAVHLGRTAGSILGAPDDVFPVGALSLAAAAVQRAFEWYLNDQPRGIAQSTFSLKSAGELTGVWYDTAVTDLVKKPHRFVRLLEEASVSVVAPVNNAKPCRSKTKAISMYIRERSSSPP